MSPSLLTLILGAAAAVLVLRYVVVYARSRAADARFAAANGCQEPTLLKSSWPLGLDLIYAAFKLAKQGHILKFFVGVVEATGTTFAQELLGTRGINTIDPKNIEAILSTQFQDFDLGERRQTFFPLLGDGIFTQDGSAWKHSRALLRPYFSNKRSNIFDEVKRQTHALLEVISRNRNGSIDLQPLFFRLTLYTTTFFLFGKSADALKEDGGANDSVVSSFGESFRISQDYLAKRARHGNLYWLVGGREFKAECAKVHKFIDDAVEEVLKATDVGPQKGDPSEAAFVETLLQETRDRQVLRDQSLNVLLAGRDTTACLLSWTFRLLASHQLVLSKLRTEISKTVGLGSQSQDPDRADLKKMQYLNDVLKEVLRLYPSVPVNSRCAARTTTLPVGGGKDGKAPVLVRKGDAAGYCVYVMHRSKALYGPDAEAFRPERWAADAGGDFNLKDVGWGYLPFNGGPRICLGQEFALLEAAYVVVRLVQTFPDIWPDPHHPIRNVGDEPQQLTLVLAPEDGCVLRLNAWESFPSR